MRKARITFNVDIPDNVSEEEVKAWVNFNLEIYCSLDGKNPMSDHEWSDLNPSLLNIQYIC